MSFPSTLRPRNDGPFTPPLFARLLCALALTSTVGNTHAASNWTNGQAATLVLGASDFTSGGSGLPPESRFSSPSDICSDPVTGKVFVVAFEQSRILRFSAAEAVTNGGKAEAVFGQPDFSSTATNEGGRSAKSLNYPFACAMGTDGRLFVVDSFTNPCIS